MSRYERQATATTGRGRKDFLGQKNWSIAQGPAGQGLLLAVVSKYAGGQRYPTEG